MGRKPKKRRKQKRGPTPPKKGAKKLAGRVVQTHPPAPAREPAREPSVPPPVYPENIKLKGIDPGPPCGLAAVEPRVGARVPNHVDAFECLDCGHEWLMSPVEQEGSWVFPANKCPRCGGLYWEWLSYDVPVADVVLTYRR